MLTKNQTEISYNKRLLRRILLVIKLTEDYLKQSPRDNSPVKASLKELKNGYKIAKRKLSRDPKKGQKYLKLMISEIKRRLQIGQTEEILALSKKIDDILAEEISHPTFVTPKQKLKLEDIEWSPINRICFRGDDRPPEVIFNDGFTPKPIREDNVIIDPILVSHNGVVQCTSRFAAAISFPMQTDTGTWVYLVKLKKGFNVHMHGISALTDSDTHTINLELNTAYKSYVHEIITEQILAKDIIGAVQIERNFTNRDDVDFPQLCTNMGAYRIVGFRMNHLCESSEEEKALAVAFIRNEMIANANITKLPLPSLAYKYNFNFLKKDDSTVSQLTGDNKKNYGTYQQALFKAISYYDLATITLCLKKGADINGIDTKSKQTPIFSALIRGFEEKKFDENDVRLIIFLLDMGADINLPNGFGQSLISLLADYIVLHKSTENINVMILVKEFIKRGVDLQFFSTSILEELPNYEKNEKSIEAETNTATSNFEIRCEEQKFKFLFFTPKIMKEIVRRNKLLLRELAISEDDEKEILQNVFVWEKILSDLTNYREMGVHPKQTFDTILSYLAKTNHLIDRAIEDEEIALAIMQTPYLKKNIGSEKIIHWLLGPAHEKVAMLILKTSAFLMNTDNFAIVEMAIAHPTVKKMILKDDNLRGRLDDQDIAKIENGLPPLEEQGAYLAL